MVPDRVLSAKDQAGRDLLGSCAWRAVVGIGVGRSRMGRGDAWAVRVYVRSEAADNPSVPALQLAGELHGIPVEVIGTGNFRPLAGPIAPDGLGRPGSPISHGLDGSNVNPGASGTLGAILKDEAG